MSSYPKVEITSEQEQMLDQAERFAKRELYPLQQRMDNEEWWPPHVMQAIANAGFTGITAPEKWGGGRTRPLH